MKSNSVILLIVLVAVSMVSAFDFSSFAEVKEIRSTEYGNNLIETISIALKNNGGKIDEISKMLDNLLFDLQKQQRKADAAWKKESARLKAKIAKLKRAIKKLKAEIAEAEDEKEKYEKLRDQAIKNLKQYRAQLEHNRKEIISIKKKRAADHAEFVRSRANHDMVIDALEEVIAKLSTLVGSVAGRHKPKHVKESAAEKRDRLFAAKHKVGKSFLQVTAEEEEANLFVQMATEADQRALMKLIKLLRKVLRSTKNSLTNDASHEASSAASAKELLAHLKEDNKKLKEMIKEEEANLKKYIAKIAALAAKIAHLKKVLKATKKELKETIAEYNRKLAQYKADKKERKSEMRVIRRMKQIVKRRLKNMSKFLKNATGGF